MSDNIRAEENFLGCLLRSPHEYWQVNDMVHADMFSVAHHRDLFAAIDSLAQLSRPVTTATLLAHLPEEYEHLGPTIGIIASLKENAAEAGSAPDYAGSIAEAAANKRLDALTKWVDKERKGNKRTAEDIAAELAMRAQEIMAQASPLRPVKLSDATSKVINASDTAKKLKIMPGHSTGLAALDEMAGLLMGGDYIGVLGALGEGKSALLAQVGKHISESGPVLSCHNEMSEEQNATRTLAGESGHSVRDIREGAFDFAGRDRVIEAQEKIKRYDYHLYTDPRMYIRSIRSRALQMKRTIGLKAVTIDAMKRLRIDAKTRDPWERKEIITGELKELAIELNVPVLAACHRTRTARRRDDPTPQLDDADFPTLEADCDMVWGVYREEAWLMMNRPHPDAGGQAIEEWEHKVRRARGVGKIIGLKIRSGEPFQKKEFKWNGPATRFENL